MNMVMLRSSGVLGLVVMALVGCTAEPPLSREAVAFKLPQGWMESQPRQPLWPGERLATYDGPHANFGIYRSLRAPGAKPENLASDLISRLANFPGYQLIAQSSRTVGGQNSWEVEATAMGDGRSWAPSGLGYPLLDEGKQATPTYRLVMPIPRASDTLWIVSYYDDPSKARPVIERALAGLSIRDEPLKTSSY